VAALLAFDYEANLKTNTEIMKKALSNIRSIEITRAARSTQMGNLKIARKQPIGFLDGDLVAVGDSNADVLNHVLPRVDLRKAEVVTIYYGGEAEPDEADHLGAEIREKYRHLQIEVIRGGQPHYDYIISVE
jgi:dihydroxyacetone kinase-like predicted kinase